MIITSDWSKSVYTIEKTEPLLTRIYISNLDHRAILALILYIEEF